MTTGSPSKLIALTGGSGAGKSWLANHLHREFDDEATTLSLDNFYCDFSHHKLSDREKVNFDHPDTIDWPLFENTLRDLQNGEMVLVPRYDFVSHTRRNNGEWRSPRPFIFVEGLWLLAAARIRELFSLRVFLDCPESLRWQRRLARDVKERGRTTDSIREQFGRVVAPMHERFVEVQKPWADLVIEQPISQTDLDQLDGRIRALRFESETIAFDSYSSQPTTPQVAARYYL